MSNALVHSGSWRACAAAIATTAAIAVTSTAVCGACGAPSPPGAADAAIPADAPPVIDAAGPPPPLDVAWIHGAPNCAQDTDPPLQVFRLDRDTYILRQNKCIDFEAPFLYLLFGDDRAFLEDTGATASAQQLPLRATIDQIIADWQAETGTPSVELVVAHSHGHGDHVAGDGQFAGRPDTVVVAATVPALQAFFGILDWPNTVASFDLGGRVLDIIPIPGHQDAHIAVYDRRTRALLTGDTLYPGRLFIRDFADYRASIARLVAFTADRPVGHVLGTHIEMTTTPGVDYPAGTTFQPDETPLELTRAHLLELDAALRAMSTPVRETHDQFIIFPL